MTLAPRHSLDLDASREASGSMRVWVRFGFGLASVFAVSVLLTLAIWATVVPLVLGWEPASIVSGSMEPLIGVGDVVVAGPYTDEELTPGTVIVFQDPAREEGLVTHRIDGVNDQGDYVTKGDANAQADSTPIRPDEIVGVGRILVPEIGWPAVWASRGDTRTLVLAGAVWLAALYFARWGALERFDPWLQPVPGKQPRRTGRGRHLARSHTGLLRYVVGIGSSLGVTAALFTFGFTTAVLADTTSNDSNSLLASNDFSYGSAVQADNPSFWWRLGETTSVAGNFTDDFEGAFTWTDYLAGTFGGSTAQAHGGTRSGLKNGNNDPNGGWKALGFSTNTEWTMEAWIYRPTPVPGGAADRIALEDLGFNGYGVQINHSANNFLIERRTSGTAATLATVVFDPPENAWYRVVLTRTGSSFDADLYDSVGTLLSSVSATDSVHGSADRMVVHGGYTYYVDDITVTTPGGTPPSSALDTQGNLNGTYSGTATWGQPSLVDGESDTSVTFDGTSWVMIGDDTALNLSTRGERSVELWFDASNLTGRQVLYEEGGTVNGMVIYLDGSNLRARAWSDTTAWSNELDTITTVSAGQTYHVVVTLDTDAGRNLLLYLDGSAVATDSKSDANDWNAHSDDGGIAAQNAGTRYHDGNSSGTGTNGFEGTIDDVAVYNTVLSASRVEAHWVAGTP